MQYVAAGRVTNPTKVQGKLAEYAHSETVPHYDLGTDYVAGPPCGLNDHDVRRTWWVRSRISAAQRPVWLALNAKGAARLWIALPVDAALDDPDAARYAARRAAALALFSHFFGPARRIARVSKVLYPKRRGFFPLLDSRVMALYRPAITTLPASPLAQVPLVWDSIRSDLLNPTNQAALVATRQWLTAQIPNQPAYTEFLQLSNVRLFDIVACW